MSDRPRRFAVLVNPRAGAGRAAERLPALEAALRRAGADFETVPTRGPGDATVRVRELLAAREHEGIAVVGGDGTMNEAVNGFFSPDGVAIGDGVWLAPLPCGTGGDFRKSLFLSRDPEPAIDRLLHAPARPIDAGWLTFVDDAGETAQRAFVNIASFGIGGLVDRLVNEGPKWVGGTGAFLLGTLRAMGRYRPRRVRITVDDGAPRETSITNVAVANGQFFGGGMHIAPRAKLDDGLFDIVGIENLSDAEQLLLTPHLYRGTLLGKPGISYTRGKKVVVEAIDGGGPVLLDVDGEAPGALPATFEIRPGALLLRG